MAVSAPSLTGERTGESHLSDLKKVVEFRRKRAEKAETTKKLGVSERAKKAVGVEPRNEPASPTPPPTPKKSAKKRGRPPKDISVGDARKEVDDLKERIKRIRDENPARTRTDAVKAELKRLDNLKRKAQMNILRRGKILKVAGVSGSGAPPRRANWEASVGSYNRQAPAELSGGYQRLVDTPSLDAYLRPTDRSILLVSRGTDVKSVKDLSADIRLIANRLSQSAR